MGNLSANGTSTVSEAAEHHLAFTTQTSMSTGYTHMCRLNRLANNAIEIVIRVWGMFVHLFLISI